MEEDKRGGAKVEPPAGPRRRVPQSHHEGRRAGTIVLCFGALDRGRIAVAVLTHSLAPVLVALSAAAVPGEARSRPVWLPKPVQAEVR
jgi:hypothetical protein